MGKRGTSGEQAERQRKNGNARHMPRNVHTNDLSPQHLAVQLTVTPRITHPRTVRALKRAVSALLLTLAISASPSAVCAGWIGSAEARMACCSEGGACPMHTGDTDSRNLSQAEADSCCAATEGDRSNPSPAPFASTISLAVLGSLTPALTPTAVAPRFAGSAASPPASSHVPKHVLLSVFIV